MSSASPSRLAAWSLVFLIMELMAILPAFSDLKRPGRSPIYATVALSSQGKEHEMLVPHDAGGPVVDRLWLQRFPAPGRADQVGLERGAQPVPAPRRSRA